MSVPVRILFTVLSAAFVVTAFPPFAFRDGLALVAWIPFLAALRGAKAKLTLSLGLLHGMLVLTGTLIWLVEIFGPLALVLHFILALFTMVFALTFHALDRNLRSPWWTGLSVAVLWTGIEYFRSEWFVLRFPWITPGTALPPNGLTPVVGVYGVSLLVILGAAWITSRARPCRLAGLGALSVPAIAMMTLSDRDDEDEPSFTVSAIQGENLSFEGYLKLTAACPPSAALVWPEYALSFDLRDDPGRLAQVRQVMAEKACEIFVVGGRTEREDGTWSNTALIVGRDSVLGWHHKNRPVHFFDDGEAGTQAPAWPTPLGEVATPICFDNDFAEVPRRAVANGAGFFLVPSMDARAWTARQHFQHAELFRHRAAENGRWMVVAASSGLTQIIDPSGRPTAVLPLFEPGILSGEIGRRSEFTLYTRFGWLLGPVSTVLAALVIVAAIIIEWRKVEEEKPA